MYPTTPLPSDSYNHISGNIYMGEFPGDKIDSKFKYIMNLYVWEPYRVASDVEMYKYTMYDSPDVPDITSLNALATWVNEKANIGPVLVHCQAGLNRSGLVTALALMQQGMKSTDAINLIRNKRSPLALFNVHFTNWLKSLDGSGTSTNGSLSNRSA